MQLINKIGLKKGDILIDDDGLNIEQWIAKKGIGIKHVSPSSTIKALQSILTESK